MGRRGKPEKVKASRKRPSARTARKDESAQVRNLEKQLADANERQAATAEILRVISQSPTEVQPVFDTIAQNAVKLCGADISVVTTVDGETLQLVAMYGLTPEGAEAVRRDFPMPLNAQSTSARTIRNRAVVHVEDVRGGSDYQYKDTARAGHWRGTLGVPMLRGTQVIGAIMVARSSPGRFADAQVALLKTFADQAVIAIGNVRLFTELQDKNQALTQAHAQVTEALEQQTATSDILRVISSSPTEVQPVFDAIARNAARLCEAFDATIFRRDGDRLVVAAHEGPIAVTPSLPLSRGTTNGRAVLDGQPVHVADMQTATEDFPEGAANARRVGHRTILCVPLMREGGIAIGTINVRRTEVELFSERQVALLKTFADQAVIAIENARLFTELESRTKELTRSVGELRALRDVGQAISSTLDLQTVLSMIVTRATELSGTDAGVIYEYDELRAIFVPRATAHLAAEIVETMLSTPVRKGEGATGRLAEVQEPIQLPDILQAPAESRVRGALVHAGYRALLAVPLVHEDDLLGGLTVIRKATGEFAPEAIELLRTFATQSTLAIENARLFREIEIKSRQLEVASRHKSEFLASMSHELRTPLNAIIGVTDLLLEDARDLGRANEIEPLERILRAGRHLLALINDILDLAKIEAGRMELELDDFHLPSAIDDALLLMRERAGRSGLAFERHVDEGLGEIRGDPRMIKQVLLNLLSNAVKFTPAGGRIDVRAALVDGTVEISVADTGIGIAPEDQEAVFEEFRQVGKAEKKAEGTGLGLALCRKFVELHGGRIWIKSAVGEGSTFTFTIPARPETSSRGGGSTEIS